MEPTSLGTGLGPDRPAADRLAAARQGADAGGDSVDGGDHAASRPRIGVVRNPRSHRNRVGAAEDTRDPDVLVAVPPNREELSRALARFAEQQIELLVVDGGDGTMREVLTRGAPVFGDHWPKLLVLPKGKTNALAVDLGIPAKYSLAEALRALPRARVVTRRPIVIDRLDAEGRHMLGFILGTGVFNAAIAAGQVAHRFGAFQGFAVAVTVTFGILQALFGIGKSAWRAIDGMRITTGPGAGELPHSPHGTAGRRFAAGFSTLGRFPLGMRPFADLGEGIKVLAVDAPLRRVIALVPAILMGLDRPFLRRLGVHRCVADDFEMELDGCFILDGESFPAGRYQLRLGPELRFLVP